MFGQQKVYPNGQNLSEILSELYRRYRAFNEGFNDPITQIAPSESISDIVIGEREEIAQYIREIGVTLREIIEDTELRTSHRHIIFDLGFLLSYLDLLTGSFYMINEAGYDFWGGHVDLEGNPVDKEYIGGEVK